MKKYLFFFLFLVLSGCGSVKYLGISEPEFSGSGAIPNRGIYLRVERINERGAIALPLGFQSELEDALLDTGFSDVQIGSLQRGDFINVKVNFDVNVNGGFAAMSILTLGILPSKSEITILYDVTFYRNGRVIRTSSYEGIQYAYVTTLSPIGLFIGDSTDSVMQEMAYDLAENIADDFPVGDVDMDGSIEYDEETLTDE